MDILRNEILKRKSKPTQNINDGNIFKPSNNKIPKLEDVKHNQKHSQNNKSKTELPETSEKTESNLNQTTTNIDLKSDPKPHETIKLPAKDEIVAKLRALGEPATLFAETNFERWQRYKKVKIALQNQETDGQKNDLRVAMKMAESNLMHETLAQNLNKKTKSKEEMNIEFEQFAQLKDSLDTGNTELDIKVVTDFINFILDCWGSQLDKNSLKEKSTLIQSTTHLSPLIKAMKMRQVQIDIADSFTKIVKCLINRSYLEANSRYLDIAIGNAPWPIGVTMSCIHNRPVKDKIATKNVAHVLNDETQRKYLQAMKRIMKWCQIMFPTDPSKCMDYMK